MNSQRKNKIPMVILYSNSGFKLFIKIISGIQINLTQNWYKKSINKHLIKVKNTLQTTRIFDF